MRMEVQWTPDTPTALGKSKYVDIYGVSVYPESFYKIKWQYVLFKIAAISKLSVCKVSVYPESTAVAMGGKCVLGSLPFPILSVLLARREFQIKD